MKHLLLGLTLLLGQVALGAEPSPWQKVTQFTAKELAEISGLEPSGLRPDVLWAHNDSGGDAALHALDLEGNFLGSVTVKGVENKDWEDLSAFTYRGKPYLLIADTGDNKHERSAVKLHAIAEPSPRRDGTYALLEATVAWTITLRYENGPQDCESIAAVPQTKRVYLLNKDSKASVVYEVPLYPSTKPGTVIAKRLATLPQTKNESSNLMSFFKAGLLGARATAMDLSADNRLAVALTYTDIRLYRREGKATWAQAFQQAPMSVALPPIYQPEALCFSADGKWIYVSSEESPTPLVRYPIGK